MFSRDSRLGVHVGCGREDANECKRTAGVTQVFKTGEFIVYPAHGVGQIVGIEEQEVAGAKL